jgi:quercetin dioxygenase-like cupin family protein
LFCDELKARRFGKMFFRHEKNCSPDHVMLAGKVVQGAKKKHISTGERIQLVQVEFAAGLTIPEHSHAEEQAGYIVKGKFEVNIGGQKGILKSGHYYWIPGNVVHSGYVHEDTVLLDIYSPPRL